MHARRILSLLVLAAALVACGDRPQMELDSEAVVDGEIPAPPDVEAPPEGAERSESGLTWVVIEPGDGETSPTLGDQVRVHYTGWQTDGSMFDSSVVRGEPAQFPVGGVIQGWVEGLQLMTEGEQRRFWIPAELAYGEDPAGGRPGGMLVFDVHVIEVIPGDGQE